MNIKKLQSTLKHHILTSELNKEKDTVGNMANCKYFDLIEGRFKEIHVIGDEIPIEDSMTDGNVSTE